MDYNNIDEDDIENLRLAALMTMKKKTYVPINTIGSTSGDFRQSRFANCNYFKNSARNYRGRFPTSNRYVKRRYTNVGLRRQTYANHNLITIIPTDNERNSQPYHTTTKNLKKNVNSKHMLNYDDSKSTDIQNLKSEVSTKFTRLEKESCSEESDDSYTIKLPLQSSPYRRSLSRSSSPRKLSLLRSRSRSPLKIKSKLGSPKASTSIRIRSPSQLKEIVRSRYQKSSSTIHSKDNKIIVDDFKKKEEVKFIEKQVELSSLDSVFEARKRKFESNKPIDITNKRIFLKKTNTVTGNKESQNKNIEPVIEPKTVDLTFNQNKEVLTLQAPQKRPRITFGHDDINLQIINNDHRK